jgi:hypothetical protein
MIKQDPGVHDVSGGSILNGNSTPVATTVFGTAEKNNEDKMTPNPFNFNSRLSDCSHYESSTNFQSREGIS